MSEPALVEGTLIAGRYRLDQPLGEGGMGTVWQATHTVTRRTVAMKFLKDSVRHRKDLRERFLREAAAASALKHPNVVEIIDVFDVSEGCPVMVMELLRGETLGSKLLRDEKLSLEETAALLLPVVSAVGAAHSFGIVHRDLKPENLFLVEGVNPTVKVLDFGIAKLSAERYLQDGSPGLLTESGSMLGTPCYMAPEQASGEQPVDHRADIWSLGVILYECLAGMRPIEGENLPQVVARLMSAGIMPLERIAPELPGEVTSLVKQMLSRDVPRRPSSLLEVSRTLGRFTNVRAPEFEAPSGPGAAPAPNPKTLESAGPKARVVASRDADPQGPTMLSSPPVNSSLHLPREAPSRFRGVLVAGSAVIGLGLVGWFLTERKPPAVAQTVSGELPTLPSPLEAPRAVAAAAPSSPVVSVPLPSVSAPPKSAPVKPRAKAASNSNVPSPSKGSDGSDFFSGRK